MLPTIRDRRTRVNIVSSRVASTATISSRLLRVEQPTTLLVAQPRATRPHVVPVPCARKEQHHGVLVTAQQGP